MLRPGMRAYFFPLVAGIALAASAFLPWVVVGNDVALTGFPDTAALWITGLGAAAAVLATLSLITRKNSRHPLLLVGLVALGIMFLSWRIMPRTISSRALDAQPGGRDRRRRAARCGAAGRGRIRHVHRSGRLRSCWSCSG